MTPDQTSLGGASPGAIDRRETLRALQDRLAARLQAASDTPAGRGWLAVECADRAFLLPLHQAGEIFALNGLTPVPHTQRWFVGVTNLRGVLHGVIDLAAFLGVRGPEPVRDGARVVALGAGLQVNAALLVDRLAGLRRDHQLSPEPPAEVQPPAFAPARWRDAEGRLWQEIDLASLAVDEHFLAIAG